MFLAALLAGIAALVIVSLLTPPEPAAQLESFFTRLHRSSDDDRERPLLLVDLLHLRRAARGQGWRAYTDDLGGFALAWIVVVVLVAATGLFLAM